MLPMHPHSPSQNVSLIMEVCEGGDLYDAILRKRQYAEAEAASVIRSVISVMHVMHANKIMHRDLKPENVVLRSTESDTSVCVIDFGQAASFTRGRSAGWRGCGREEDGKGWARWQQSMHMLHTVLDQLHFSIYL